MWHVAYKFASKEEAGTAYTPLQGMLRKTKDDISIFRIMIDQIWHVVLLGNKPSPSMLQAIQHHLQTGTIATLSEYTLTALENRRDKRVVDAIPMADNVGMKWNETHKPTAINIMGEAIPYTEKAEEVEARELARDFNERYGTNIRERQVPDKQKKQIVASPHRPFIITFQENSDTTQDKKIFEMMSSGNLQFTSKNDMNEALLVLKIVKDVHNLRLRMSSKYLFTDSAMHMHNAVFNPLVTSHIPLPMAMVTNTWVELATPLLTPYGEVKAVYLNNAYPLQQIDRVIPPSQEYVNTIVRRTFSPHKHQWSLDVITTDSDTLYDFTFDTTSNEWVFLASHICPSKLCKYFTDDMKKLQTLGICVPCDSCKQACEYWAMWLYTSLEIIHKKYATSPEETIFSVDTHSYETEALHTVGHGKNQRKINRMVSRNVDYTIVKFDVSVKTTPKEAEEASGIKRENWLTLADKDNIIYEKRMIQPYDRKYPTRKNGTRRDGRVEISEAYSKYVPLLATKQRVTIKKVVARKFESEV